MEKIDWSIVALAGHEELAQERGFSHRGIQRREGVVVMYNTAKVCSFFFPAKSFLEKNALPASEKLRRWERGYDVCALSVNSFRRNFIGRDAHKAHIELQAGIRRDGALAVSSVSLYQI